MTRHIVVVEDEPLVRMDAVAMLETAGLSVVEFDRADAALDFTREHAADIAAIFTDVNLRGSMDGIDLAVEVSHAEPAIAIVVTSGGYDKRPGSLPSRVAFVKKPWLPLEVLGMMQGAATR